MKSASARFRRIHGMLMRCVGGVLAVLLTGSLLVGCTDDASSTSDNDGALKQQADALDKARGVADQLESAAARKKSSDE